MKLNRTSLLIMLSAALLVAVAVLVFLNTSTVPPKLNSQAAAQAANDAVASQAPPKPSQRDFVGSQQCADCHQEQYQSWQQSHHRHAFAIADSNNVLADFSSQLNYTDGLALFEKTDKPLASYQIRIQSPNAPEQVYPVAFTLGHYPLQQYLLETAPGNYQVFALAWDARPKAQGGQRWMELQAGESSSEDNAFHWRNYFQNWNSQCADCHTTNYAKAYTAPVVENSAVKAKGQFHSSWSEAGVTCESCHGPASQHIDWANAEGQQADDNNKGFLKALTASAQWHFKEGQAIASPAISSPAIASSMPALNQPQGDKLSLIDSCAACHSLRQPISGLAHERGDSAWSNYFEPSRVREPLYFADGQIREEVFVYGSFTQSKMFHAGVTCANCHNVHSGKVKDFDAENLAQPENDAVCAQCHRADVYAVKSHHHHPLDSEAARCVSCHMPERTYMQVDPRRDHSFQKPSPALSELLGTPNVCVDCHSQLGQSAGGQAQDNQWAANTIAQWQADTAAQNASVKDIESAPDFSSWLLSFAKLQAPSAALSSSDISHSLQALELGRYQLLASSKTPAMKKAMLLQSMPIDNAEAYQALVASLSDPDVVVRLAAIERFADMDSRVRQQMLTPLLDDPIKSVRLVATLALADLASTIEPSLVKSSVLKPSLLKQRIAQFIAAYQNHEDLLASQLKLAELFLKTGDFTAAEKSYHKALALVPSYVPAMINLADLYRIHGRDDSAEKILLKALSAAKDNSQASLRETGDTLAQSPALHSAYQAALQQQATVEYSLGLLYVRIKDYPQAAQSLKRAAKFAPQNPDYLYAYCLTLDALGQREQAVELLLASPLLANNRQLAALLKIWQ